MDELTMKQKIRGKYDSLSEIEKKVAKYILDNYHQSMLLSSTELAQQAGVSNTAVVRFAKDMGYSGFLEYRRELKKEYVPTQKVYASLSLMEKGTERDFLHNYFKMLLGDMTQFVNLLDTNLLSSMADALIRSRMVYLVGFGSDEIVVHFLKNYLNVMGLQCIPVTEEGLALREKMFLLREDDVVVMSAYPTLMDSELWVGKYVKTRKAKLLVITDSEVTAKQLGADLYAAFNERTDNFFNSYVLPMSFCNALLLHMYERYPQETAQAMERYQTILE